MLGEAAPREPPGAVTGAAGAGRADATTPSGFAGGRYEPLRLLGEGGRKRVYLARDTRLDREVALAIVKTEGLDDVGLTRARREAESMARLGDHPHIVPVYDIGEQDGQLFIVSQYMAGGDLDGLLDHADERRLSIEEVLRIGGHIGGALEHAHAHGIIHRDLKPRNVWLSEAGTAKLGDFGLAVALDRSRLTSEGLMVGTVAYMPPEQGLGRPVDARSDLYSLGAVLYEMLCGRPPFVGDDAVALISQHVKTPPVGPSWHRGGIPEPLEQLVLKLLAKAPDERPESAAEVVRAVDAISAVSETAERARPNDTAALERLAEGVFLGREHEVEAMRAGVDQAVAGRGRLVMIAGESGIGKTRLAAEVATYAGLRGAQVLWGRCYEGEGAPAYWPWVQVIRSYVHDREPDALAAQMGVGAADIAQVVSEVRERIPGLPEPPTLEPEQARFRLFDSITTFLTNAAAERPLAIFLDDLHTADKPSLLLLQFLARELRSSRLFVAGAYRDTELDSSHPLSEVLAALRRERAYERVVLRGLTRDDVRGILEGAAQHPLEGPNELALAEAVHRETEGNPYFVEEVVRHLVETGRIYQQDGRWVSDARRIEDLGIPEGIRDTIGRRLARLSEECNGLLTVASVLGREFRLDALQQVSDLSPETVAELLDEAIEENVVRRVPDQTGRYRFAHATIREILYGDIATARRAALHHRIARVLEEVYDESIEAHLGELAHHFVEGAQAGEADKAVDYAWWAGERAVSLYAYEDAARHFGRGLELLQLRQEASERSCELLLALGDARWRSGNTGDAKQAFTEAARIAGELSAPELYARAALGYGGRAGGFGVVDRPDETLLEMLRTALTLLPETDAALRVRVMARLAVELYMTDRLDEREELSRRAVEMAERIGQPGLQLLALYSRRWALLGPDDLEDQVAAADEMLRLAQVVGDREMEFRARHFRLNALLHLGEPTAAEHEIHACARLAQELRQPYYQWQAAVFTAMGALVDGRYDQGEHLAQEAFVLGQQGQNEMATVIFGAQLFIARWQQGRLEELKAGGESFASTYPESAWPSARAFLLAEIGDEDEARAALEAEKQRPFEKLRKDLNWLTAMSTLSFAANRLDDPDAAARLYALLRPYADRYTIVLTGAGTMGSVELFLGLLAATLSRWDEAVERFERAAERNARVGARFLLPLADCERAVALLARDHDGDRGEALEVVERALETAHDLKMPALVERLLAMKLEAEGIAAADPQTSIDVVAESVSEIRPNLTPVAAPDGTVTIMFSDIEDSTLLNERLGDRRWLELLHRHNQIVRRHLRQHGGFEVKSQGDGFMLAFASARRALRCAIDIQRELGEPGVDRADESLRVRIGLHTGEAIREEEDFFGRNVVLAARIAQRASGGQILVSSLLKELVEGSGDFAFATAQEVELKGLRGRHRVFPLVTSGVPATETVGAASAFPSAEPDGAPPGLTPLSPALAAASRAGFVGRESQLTTLLHQLDRSRIGERRLVMLAGEPGIGKTSLCTEVARRSHAEGGVALYGRCDHDALIPYQPFVEALEHYIASSPPERLRTELGVTGGEVARLIPELRRIIPDLPGPQADEPDMERYRLFEAVSGFLSRIAARAPVVLVLDDLHWADQPTLQLLRHLMRSPTKPALLILATYRETEIGRKHPLTEMLSELRRHEAAFERISVQGLDEAEVADLITARLGKPPPAELALALWRETEGHPLFVQEVLRHLVEVGAIRERRGEVIANVPVGRMGIPQGVKEVVQSRLARLEAAAVNTLTTASVIGREFGIDLLEASSASNREELAQVLEPAAEAGIIADAPGAKPRYGFSHALIRETLYGAVASGQRASLHRRVAEALERLTEAAGDDRPLADLARHYFEATRSDESDEQLLRKAVGYATAAGERAREQLGYEEAAQQYGRALEAIRILGGDAERECALLLGMGESQWSAGEFLHARVSFARAGDLAGQLGDAEQLARAALGYAGPSGFGAGLVDDQAIGLLERALQAMPEEETPLRTRVMGRLAETLSFSDQRERAAELATAAVDAARRQGEKTALADVLSNAMWTQWTPDNVADRLAAATEIVELAEEVGATRALWEGRAWRVGDLMELSDVDAVDRELETAWRLAREVRQPYYLSFVSTLTAMRRLLDGRVDEGERLMWQAFEIGAEQENTTVAQLFGVQLFQVRMLQGRLMELHAATKGMTEHFKAVLATRCSLALLYCEGGMVDEAQREFDELASDGFAVIPRDMFWLSCMDHLADVCGYLEDAERAAVLYELLRPYADRYIVNAEFAAPKGFMSRHLGVLAATMGRFDEAATHFETALVKNTDVGPPYAVVQTQLDYARMLVARSAATDRSRALRFLDAAVATSDELGYRGLGDKARALKREVETGETSAPRAASRLGRRLSRVGGDARAAISTRGRSALARLYGDASDEELERRFGSPLAQRALLAGMAGAFQPRMAYGFEGEIQFELIHVGGERPSDFWTLEVKGKRASAKRRTAERPAVALQTTVPDFVRVFSGELNPITAWLNNAVRVEGDVGLGARLVEMFGGVAPFEAIPAAEQSYMPIAAGR